MWFKLYGRQAVRHALKKGPKTHKKEDLLLHCATPLPATYILALDTVNCSCSSPLRKCIKAHLSKKKPIKHQQRTFLKAKSKAQKVSTFFM